MMGGKCVAVSGNAGMCLYLRKRFFLLSRCTLLLQGLSSIRHAELLFLPTQVMKDKKLLTTTTTKTKSQMFLSFFFLVFFLEAQCVKFFFFSFVASIGKEAYCKNKERKKKNDSNKHMIILYMSYYTVIIYNIVYDNYSNFSHIYTACVP